VFPIDVDIENIKQATIAEGSTASIYMTGDIGRSIVFDYDKEEFVLVDGKCKEPSKIEAIKQWVELFIRTELNKYVIYTDEFGVDMSGLLGYRLPRSYQVAEIMRTINKGILTKCPNVVSVSEWNFDKGNFSFTVTTNTGEEVVISE